MTTATLPSIDPQAVRAAQLQMRCQQGVRVPYVVLVLAAFIVRLLWDLKPHVLLVGWAALTVSVLLARSACCRRYVEHAPRPDELDRLTRTMAAFSFTSGLVGGTPGWLFFPGLPLVEQALLTMVLMCWSAIAVGTTSAMPRNFPMFALPFLGPIAVSWLFSSMPDGPYVGVLILFFLVVQQLITRDNSRQLLRSIAIRLENAALIVELRREREEADAASELAETANRGKSRFLAAASHDLRQPLHALSLYSAALSQTVTQPRVQKIAHNIEVCVQSLDALFEALLDISKLDAGIITPQLRAVRIQSLLDRLGTEFEPQARAKGLALSVDGCEGWIETDPVLLERILRNLLDNAVRYTERGSIALCARTSAGRLEIEVRDTGVGVPTPEHERIFDEFYRLDGRAREARVGLGLGLATVRRIAALLGCAVRLHSEPGVGSVFSLRLERTAVAAASPPPPVEARREVPGELSSRIVLVLEDDPRAAGAMRTLLHEWGCIPLVAAGIDDAIAALDSAARPPDIVLADYRLGDTLTGPQAIAALGERVAGIPALLITGDTDAARIRDAKASGFALLHKPVKAALLHAQLAQLLYPEVHPPAAQVQTQAQAALPAAD